VDGGDAGPAARTGGTVVAAEKRIGDWWRELVVFRRANTRAGATLYSWHVNYLIGAALARPLLPTRVTANQLTLLSMLVNVATSVYVIASGQVTLAVAALALAGWQLGYSLDCADGQIARARHAASPFGAWLDQCADFVSHVAVVTSMAVVVSRAAWMTPAGAALIAGLACGANLFGLFATSQYNSLLGRQGGGVERHHPPAWLRKLEGMRNLTDYGFFILIAALCLQSPAALLTLLVVAGSLQTSAVVAQVALNWGRGRRA
jgi:phosphatidylglycerophosphate synthase